jgi:hypothetical protein
MAEEKKTEEKKTEDDFGKYVKHMKENIEKIKIQFQLCFDKNEFFDYFTLKQKIFAPGEPVTKQETITLPDQEEDFKESYVKLQKYVYYHYLNEAPRIIIGNTVVYKTQVEMETILRNHVNDDDDFLYYFDTIVNQKGYIVVDGARWDGIKIHPKKSRKNHKSKNKSNNKSNNKSRRQRRKM